MKMPRRFPGNFFKSLRDDPILDETVGLFDPLKSFEEEDHFTSLNRLTESVSGDGDGESASKRDPRPEDALQKRSYTINSIFTPPEIREETNNASQQLIYIKEHDGYLVGLQEVNSLLNNGWTFMDAYPIGNSAVYKALILLERQL